MRIWLFLALDYFARV